MIVVFVGVCISNLDSLSSFCVSFYVLPIKQKKNIIPIIIKIVTCLNSTRNGVRRGIKKILEEVVEGDTKKGDI